MNEAQRRRAFWGVMACFLVHGLEVSTWVSRIASVKAALHLSDGALGLALLGTAIGSITAIPLCGALVVRYGSREIARWTAVGFCTALVAIPFAVSTATLFAALFFYGAMAGANDVAMNAQAVATERRLGTPVISRFHAMFSIGGMLGACVGAFLAGQGMHSTTHLIGGAILFFFIAMLSTKLLVDTRTERSESQSPDVRTVPACDVSPPRCSRSAPSASASFSPKGRSRIGPPSTCVRFCMPGPDSRPWAMPFSLSRWPPSA